MKQLSGIDASFLYMETGTEFGHVSGLAILSKPDVPGWSAYEETREQFAHRLPAIEPFRRRVVEVPFNLDHPFWINDPDFDIDYHVRESAVPPPGTDRQLADVVGRIISRPLDRAHPLWEVYVIEGLAEDRFAVLTKIHHAAVDGALGAELMGIIYDAAPDTPLVEPPDTFHTEPVPTGAQVLQRALLEVVHKPGKLARLQVRSLRALGELTRNEGLTGLSEALKNLPNPRAMLTRRRVPLDPDAPPEVPSGTAPPTPFNGTITPHRRVVIRSASLVDIKAIKNALGVTVNDVVMAVCSGALRAYLDRHEALPINPLVAMVPVSIRTGLEDDPWTNRVSAVFTPIPTDVPDAVDRVRDVHKAMDIVKERFLLLPADLITDYSQFAPPALAIRAIRMATRLRIGDRINPPFNLVVSNVPGPRSCLYLAGATLERYYPLSTIVEGMGLNITVQSYVDSLDIGLVACRERVPDLEVLGDLIIEEIEGLAASLGVKTVTAARGDAQVDLVSSEQAKVTDLRQHAPSGKGGKSASGKGSKSGRSDHHTASRR